MFFYKKELTYERLCDVIKKGFSCIRHAFFPHVVKNENDFDLILTLSPKDYYSIPIAKVISFFLNYHNRDLGEMSETAIHEAFSNTFLWGLLHIDKTNSYIDFETAIYSHILKKQHQLQTLSIGVSIDQKNVNITFINPYDDLNVNTFLKHQSNHMRGLDILKRYSHVVYDPHNKTIQLHLESDIDNEHYAVAQ
jgi:hypothetical protein